MARRRERVRLGGKDAREGQGREGGRGVSTGFPRSAHLGYILASVCCHITGPSPTVYFSFTSTCLLFSRTVYMFTNITVLAVR